MTLICEKCGSSMRKVSTMNSGNAIFETWQCNKCSNRKQQCVGVQ